MQYEVAMFEVSGSFGAMFDRSVRWFEWAIGSRGMFKLGRTSVFGLPALRHREMYRGAREIRACAIQPRRRADSALEADAIEVGLTKFALDLYPRRCRNQKLGGGPSSELVDHAVYVVLWP